MTDALVPIIDGDLPHRGEPENLPRWLDLRAAFSAPPPPLDFALPGLLSGTVGAIVSPGGTGKTMLALALAAAVVSGDGGLVGMDLPAQPGRVLYLSGEDPEAVLHQRLHALGERLDQPSREEAERNLFVMPLLGVGFDIEDARWAIWMQRAAAGARLVIIDTLRRAHRRDENDGGAMAAVLGRLEALAAASGAAVVFLHHVGKAAALNDAGDAQQASRGSSVLVDNVRWQCNLTTMSAAQGDALGVGEEGRRRYVRLTYSKLNYCAPLPDQWFQRGAGGVLAPVELNLNQQAGGAGRGAAPRARARNKAKANVMTARAGAAWAANEDKQWSDWDKAAAAGRRGGNNNDW